MKTFALFVAYGGVALLWLWLWLWAVDGTRPTAWDVVGIALRTHNAQAFQTIPAHRGHFAQAGLAECLPQRQSDDVLAVYITTMSSA
jgi:hypothetical protein